MNMHDQDTGKTLEERILLLKDKMNAVILSHYYQDSEIQDIADFVGDSLALSQYAATTDADVIVFCGVKFMAESAYILNPTKMVLLPDINAGCSLELSCQPKEFKAFKDKYPDSIAVTYINCSADIKALSDIIVTSSNAKKIIESLPKDRQIIFAPDKHLGSYLIKETGRDMILWNGSCIVHENFSERELIKLKTKYPNAKIIAHPECPETLLNYAHHIGSTSSLIDYAKQNDGAEMIVLTETGVIHQMKKKSPNAKFYEVSSLNQAGCASCSQCHYMRLNTLEKVYNCMLNQFPQISVSSDIAFRAKSALDKMLQNSNMPIFCER
jgi:quinolinate synthase